MKKLVYDASEWYPCYTLAEAGEDRDFALVLSDEAYEDYLRVQRDWETWQRKISEMLK